jgi:hypothetical protein
MMKRTVAFFLALGMSAVPALASDALLARLVGDWTGRGTMKTSPSAAPERVFCKVNNSLSGDGTALTQKGRCSLASNSGPIAGTIASVGSNLYSGTLDSLASKGPASLAGSGLPNRLELNAEYVDALDGSAARSLITIELVSGGYRLSSKRTNPDGSAYLASEIVFSAN